MSVLRLGVAGIAFGLALAAALTGRARLVGGSLVGLFAIVALP